MSLTKPIVVQPDPELIAVMIDAALRMQEARASGQIQAAPVPKPLTPAEQLAQIPGLASWAGLDGEVEVLPIKPPPKLGFWARLKARF